MINILTILFLLFFCREIHSIYSASRWNMAETKEGEGGLCAARGGSCVSHFPVYIEDVRRLKAGFTLQRCKPRICSSVAVLQLP